MAKGEAGEVGLGQLSLGLVNHAKDYGFIQRSTATKKERFVP